MRLKRFQQSAWPHIPASKRAQLQRATAWGAQDVKAPDVYEHIVHNGLGKELNIDFDYMDEPQEVRGQWHDNKLVMAFFSNKKFDNKDIDSMKTKNEKLEKVITDKASSFKKKINADNAWPDKVYNFSSPQ